MMMNHVSLEPVSVEKRRRIRHVRDNRRNVWAVWTLILGGCTMTYIAIAATLKIHIPF